VARGARLTGFGVPNIVAFEMTLRILTGVATALVAASAHGQTAISLGTATPGGGFPLYGAAFADVVNANEPTLRIEPRNTKGSTENVPLLESGGLDIALVQGEVANPVLAKADTPLRIITAMYSSPGMFVVRGDSPYRTIADLRGRPVALGAQGSGLTILGRNVLAAIGIDPDRDIQAIYLDRAGDGPAMVLDGRAAALWGAGVGWPGFTAVAKAGGRFIAPDAEEMKRILAQQSFLKPMTIPAGSYPGQDAAIATVGSWSFVLARPGLPDDVAFRIARALHKGEAALGSRLAQARETTAANTVAAVPRADLIHPGVAKYLREAGVLR
jgi:TRAP transporter TAXI family solute receptor